MLDTPGLFDFAAGFYEGARAADSLLIVLSGRSGLTVGAEKAFKMANDLKKSKMVYISKMDTENADFYKVLEDLKAAYGPFGLPDCGAVCGRPQGGLLYQCD